MGQYSFLPKDAPGGLQRGADVGDGSLTESPGGVGVLVAAPHFKVPDTAVQLGESAKGAGADDPVDGNHTCHHGKSRSRRNDRLPHRLLGGGA